MRLTVSKLCDPTESDRKDEQINHLITDSKNTEVIPNTNIIIMRLFVARQPVLPCAGSFTLLY